MEHGVPLTTVCNTAQKLTSELEDLLKNKTNKGNAQKVANELKKNFKSGSPKHKTKRHVDLAAAILEDIVSIKDRLNETAELVMEIVDVIMDMNKTTLKESENASSKVIRILDNLAKNVPMEEGKTTKVLNTTNVVLQANDITKTSYKGITFGVTKDGSIAASSKLTTTSVKLPSSLLSETDEESVRIGFIYYANNKLFQVHRNEKEQQQHKDTSPSQQVLSSSVYNTTTSNLSDPVILNFSRRAGAVVSNSTCVFWNGKARQWSNFGCSLCAKQESNDRVECCCNHLTSFAVLFSPVKRKPSADDDVHAMVLSIISYVGCVISILGVALTFLTYSVFRHLRKTNQQSILMNLCVAIALLLIVFLAGVNSTNNRLGCQIVAVLLHYLTLVTVFWMGIEAYNLYLQIVKVMAIYQRKFMLKAAVVGWGVPLLIVLATLTAAIIQYKQTDGTTTFYYGNDYACILHNQLYSSITWFAPILVILAFNMFVFISVLYHLRKTMATLDTKSNHKKHCWTALAIMVLLGLTWLFGALAISDARIVFEYLFCIFNSLQGFFIFFFHCVRIKEVRNQWSFFVSGLGFSQSESSASRYKSNRNGESH